MSAAASTAVRNYCGWHVYPSQSCQWVGYVGASRNVSRVGSEILIQLPAKYVTKVTSVKVGGNAVGNYLIETNGILRLICRPATRYEMIEVDYTAGLPDSLMDAVKELVAHRMTHALSSSYGVTSEAAGGVSITYNATWAATSRATALADDNKEVLQPYRIQGVF